MMPGKVYYEKELAAIISIDQSGSMSDSDLEKINYVIHLAAITDAEASFKNAKKLNLITLIVPKKLRMHV